MSDKNKPQQEGSEEQKKLKNKYGVGSEIGSGLQGKVHKTNKEGEVIKISNIRGEDQYKKEFYSSLNPLGGGFTKPIEYEEDNIELVEIFKERLMELFNVVEYVYGLLDEEEKIKIEADEKKKKVVDNFSPLVTMIQIANALEKMHLVGLFHNDLKLDNVLVDKNGVCKISDFGLSKNIESNPDKTGKNDIIRSGHMFKCILCRKFIGNLNINDIKLDKFYPDVDFGEQSEIEKGTDERLSNLNKNFFDLIDSMILGKITIFEVKEKLADLIMYIGKNFKNKNGKPIDFIKDLKIREKDLYGLGIIEGVNLDNIKEKYREEIDSLIKYSDKTPDKRKTEKEKNIHLKTVLGDEDNFSAEAKECLISLKACIGENEIVISEDFRSNFETLKNKKNKREISIVFKRLLDLEKLQLAKQGKGAEEFEAKSLISTIEEDPKRIKDLFILDLNYDDEDKLEKDKNYWKIALLKGANNNNFSYITKFLGIIFNEKNFGINDEGIIGICLLYICKNMEMDKILQLLNNCEDKIGIDTEIGDSMENRNDRNVEIFRILLKKDYVTNNQELIKEVFYSCYREKSFKLIKELFSNESIDAKYFPTNFDFSNFVKNLEEFEYFKELFDTSAVKNNVLLFSKMLFRLISIYDDENSKLMDEASSDKISSCYTNLIKNMPKIKQEDKTKDLTNIIANCLYYILEDYNLSEEDWKEVTEILIKELEEKDIISDYDDGRNCFNLLDKILYSRDIKLIESLIESGKIDLNSKETMNHILYSCDIELIKSLIESRKIDLDSEKIMNHITDCICNLEQDKQEERKELINLFCESNKKLLILIHGKLESYKEQLEINEKYKAILGALEEYKQNDSLPNLTNDFFDNLNECLNYAGFVEENTINGITFND